MNIRTIGLMFQNFSQGGIQRVLSNLVPIFANGGYEVVLLSTLPAHEGEYEVHAKFRRIVIGAATKTGERWSALKEAIAANHIDLIIHHEYYYSALDADIKALEETGVPFLIHQHNVFSNMLLRDKRQLDMLKYARLYQHADGLLVLSHVDEAFAKMLGMRAFYMPNPVDRVQQPPAPGDSARHNILWFARFTDVKQPTHALNIFAKVLQSVPDAELYMLGDTTPFWGQKSLEWLNKNSSVAAHVHLEGFKTDVFEYLRKSAVSLITSKFEGFCLSIMESKSCSVPVVSYAMPYLETTHEGEGVISVPQGDIAKAAAEIVKILTDDKYASRIGAEGRRAYEKSQDVDLLAEYRKVFAVIEKEPHKNALGISKDESYIMLETLLEHGDLALRTFKRNIDNQAKQLKECKDKIAALEAEKKQALANALSRFCICCFFLKVAKKVVSKVVKTIGKIVKK